MSNLLETSKRFPGVTHKNADGKPIHWRFGTVIKVNQHTIWADCGPSSVHQRNISLQGDAYCYVCQQCSGTITEKQTKEAQEQPDRDEERCPQCKTPKSLRYVKLGEKMRFHYRHDPEGKWAGWYGEVLVGS